MNDTAHLFKFGMKVLSDRDTWYSRQRKWSQMRTEGIRRRNKPFPTAADLHLKLVDEKVNQKKAFTMATILGQPQLSTFVSMRSQPQPITESAGQFFDYEMKQRTNFLRVMTTVVDTMWLRGRGIVKAYIDPFDDNRIVHENIDPLYLLMPDDVNGFEDSYAWIQVKEMNVAQFKINPRYCLNYRNENGEVDDKTVQRLCGGKDAETRLAGQKGFGVEEYQLDKELRQGFTHSGSSDTITIWEHVVKTMGGYWVYTYCPVAMDVEIRKTYGIPYKVDGRVSSGYFSFPAEIRDEEGWYAPRGIAERIADNEIYGCKVWNAKADAMTFLTTPQYTSEVGVQNPANYRVAPGEVLPPGVKPAIFGQPTVSFDQEIAFTRGEAELASQSVDVGIEKPNQRGNQKRTKYEVGVAQGIAQVGQTLEAHTFKEDLAKVYRHNWSLMLQYKRKQLTFFISDDLKTMPEEALHNEYAVSAGGSTDDWDKQQRIARASDRYQLLVGKPNINQDELVTDLLSAEDARLVKKLVIPQNQRIAGEVEDETQEIVSMMVTHFAAPVKEQEDHLSRAKAILQFLQSQDAKKIAMDPLAKQRIFQHLQQHLALLKKQNPQGYKQLEQVIMQMEQQAAAQRPQPRRMSQPKQQSKFAMI